MKALIVGASRGIGLELAAQSRAAGMEVFATARDEAGLERLRALDATALLLDVADVESCASLSWQIDGLAFDTLILNAGIYGPRSRKLQTPAASEFDAVMHTNVLGAMRLLPLLCEHLAPSARLAVVSSRMGAIEGRTGTAGWLYRASKAALNSVLKDASLVLDGRAVCVALHPGWVQTDMNDGAGELTAQRSAQEMLRVIAGLTAADNGRFLDHGGNAIAW
jgi:NAD(P)-dependent dehydrogenase (short-subunit alcohol dehydrogenase family)